MKSRITNKTIVFITSVAHRIVRNLKKVIETEYKFIFIAIYELIFQAFLTTAKIKISKNNNKIKHDRLVACYLSSPYFIKNLRNVKQIAANFNIPNNLLYL